MFRNGRLMGVLLLVMSWSFLSFQAVAAEQPLPDPKTGGLKGFIPSNTASFQLPECLAEIGQG